LTLVSSTVTGFAAGLLSSSITTTISNQSSTTALNGTYTGGILTLPVSSQIYVDLSDTLPGLWLQANVNGTVVAQLVPEPSSVILRGFALAGLGYYGARRRRK